MENIGSNSTRATGTGLRAHSVTLTMSHIIECGAALEALCTFKMPENGEVEATLVTHQLEQLPGLAMLRDVLSRHPQEIAALFDMLADANPALLFWINRNQASFVGLMLRSDAVMDLVMREPEFDLSVKPDPDASPASGPASGEGNQAPAAESKMPQIANSPNPAVALNDLFAHLESRPPQQAPSPGARGRLAGSGSILVDSRSSRSYDEDEEAAQEAAAMRASLAESNGAPPIVTEADEEVLANLIEMTGRSREDVVQAFLRAGKDADSAAASLFG